MKNIFHLVRAVWRQRAAMRRSLPHRDDSLPQAFRRSEAFAEDLGGLVSASPAVMQRRWRRRRAAGPARTAG